jgi:protein ImuA
LATTRQAGAGLLDELRARIAGLERRSGSSKSAVVAFGVGEIDAVLPNGGLARGALHEVAGRGPDVEPGAAAARLIAGLLARMRGPVLWVSAQRDLFAPALAAVGLSPARVIHVEAGRAVLLAMEEGLRHPGLAGVVGEVAGFLGLTASRRLQLAAETSGVIAFALRRSRRFDDPRLAAPSAAATRWRIACLPSPPPLAHAPQTPGLAPALWRLDLVRARGGGTASWIVEACDAQGGLRLAAHLADGPAASVPGDVRASA